MMRASRSRGASSGDVLRAERDAAPAAVPRKHGLGRPGVTVRLHYGSLPSMAGRGLDEGGRQSAGEVILIVLAPEARSPGQKSPRMERRKAERGSHLRLSQAGGEPRDNPMLRQAALHLPSFISRRARAAQTTGMPARGCLTKKRSKREPDAVRHSQFVITGLDPVIHLKNTAPKKDGLPGQARQ